MYCNVYAKPITLNADMYCNVYAQHIALDVNNNVL